MDHKSEIRQAVQGLLAQKGDARPFTDDSSLFLSGRLDSVDSVEVLLLLETRFGINIPAGGFDRAKIDSVDAIDALIRAAS